MKRNKKAQVGVVIGIAGAAFAILVIILLLGFDTVDASHIGVKNKFGVIQGTMQPGMAWTGLFVHVEQYDLRMQKMTVEMIKDETSAVDIDGQTIKARIEINYRINPDNIERAYSKVGRQRDMPSILNLDGIIREGFKTTTSKYKSKEIWQNRQEVKEKSIETITANFPLDYFVLENVIISDIDFNPEFIAAIELQKTNEELAIAKEKAVEVAKQEANAAIEIARGAAESKKLAAEALAFQTLAQAKAEAEGLALKKQQITPLTVQNSWVNAWHAGGAQVPMYIAGGGEQFLMSMPAIELEE